jgi:hypothetical protein
MSKEGQVGSSRIAGRGGLLRSLRILVRRVDRFGQHRAATATERSWSHRLADALEAAYRVAAGDPKARASLAHADDRSKARRKVHRTEAPW